MTDPIPAETSAETLAHLLNLTARRVQQLAREGVMVRGGKGRYRLTESVRAYNAYLQATGGAGDGDPSRLDPFRRRAHYQAESERLELETRAGTLIPRDDVERTFARVFDQLARFLDVLPDRLERAGLANADQAERIVEWTNAARIELHAALTATEPPAEGGDHG